MSTKKLFCFIGSMLSAAAFFITLWLGSYVSYHGDSWVDLPVMITCAATGIATILLGGIANGEEV